MDFDKAFAQLLVHEGGFSNHKDDPGKKTMWGVTEAVARENGYNGPMRDMPVDVAKSIYRKQYWERAKCDQLPPLLRYVVFDGAVNSGVGQSVKWLQRALNVTDDGVIGPKTIAAANAAPLEALYRRLLAQRLKFMTDLDNWSSFSKGWARRIASLLEI